MATEIIPSTMTAFNNKSTHTLMAGYTSDSQFNPTTAVNYAIRIPKEDGKVMIGLFITGASTLNNLRVNVYPGQSTDGAWMTTKSTVPIQTFYTPANGSTAMRAHFFPLPDSAKFAAQSTGNAAYQTVILQFEGSTAPGTTGSTTLATVATTISAQAFVMYP
jgi:hypothetical protein